MGSPRRLACLLILTAACGGTAGPAASPACRPGTVDTCDCGGRPGSSTCDAAGRPGPCACPVSLELSPAELDFGEAVRSARREATVSLRNPGSAPVVLRRVTLSADTHPSFTVASAPSVVGPGGQVAVIVVDFRTDVPVDASGTLLVEAEGSEGVLAVPLRGAAVGPHFSCPATVDFGEQRFGVAVSRTVTCRNVGVGGIADTGAARPQAVVADDPEFSGAHSSVAVAPNEDVTFEVRYLPSDDEADRATVRLLTDKGVEAVVTATGTSRLEPCELEVRPVTLTGVPGEDLAGYVGLRNLRGDVGCLLERIEPDAGCAAGYSFELPPPTALVAGGTLDVPFVFRSAEQGTHRCTLRVETGGGGERVFRAALQAELSWRPCLLAGPTGWIPPTTPSCGPSSVTTELVNRCRRGLVVHSIGFGPGASAWFSADAGELPATIPPAGTLPVTVWFDPDQAAGANTQDATLEVRSPFDPEPWRFDYSSARMADATETRTTYQRHGGVLDVLAVIDNGATMAAEAPKVVEALGPLPERLAGHDFRLAVVTTGLQPASGGGCPGGVAGGEDGRFFPADGSRPRVVTPATPNARAVWEANLAVGACHDLPAQPFAAVARALDPSLAGAVDDPSHPEPNDGNLGVLRRNVPLFLIFFGDRDDASPMEPGAFWGLLRFLRGAAVIDVAVVAGAPATGCTGPQGEAAAPGNNLHLLADVAAGTHDSICAGPWDLAERYAIPIRSCFDAGGVPADWNRDGRLDEDDLEVRVGGVEVPPVELDGHVNWSWDRDAGEVCFPPGEVPDHGAAVSVKRLVCG